MTINKRYLFLFCFLILFVFSGCQSTQDIYTMKSETGQMFFIRPIALKKVSSEVKEVDFDMTVQVNEAAEISENPVVNYTFVISKDNYSLADDVNILFGIDDEVIETTFAKVIYKEIDSSKNLNVRFTGSIDKDDFAKMIENPSFTKIIVKINDKTYSFSSRELSEKLMELGVLVS